MKVRLNFSARYLVVGIYKDRKFSILRVYLPFTRLSLYFGDAQPS